VGRAPIVQQCLTKCRILFWRSARTVAAIPSLIYWLVTLQFFSRLRLFIQRLSARRVILSSGLFDPEWYLREYRHLRRRGFDPALHYLYHGAAEGRNPSLLFDTEWYVSQNPQLKKTELNPLIHYLRSGRSGGDTGALLPSGFGVTDRQNRMGPQCDSNLVPLNIVFVNYSSFSSASADHITGFANVLASRGHNILICAGGAFPQELDWHFGQIRYCNRAFLTETPEFLREFIGCGRPGAATLVHCWTPRENVRVATTKIAGYLACPYFVHLEDNEELLMQAQIDITDEKIKQLTDKNWQVELPSYVSHPVGARRFISDAAGVTVIVDRLRELASPNSAIHLLEPGVDENVFSSDLQWADRRTICSRLGLPSDVYLIYYPGNVHVLNQHEVLTLYQAIRELNEGGLRVHLLRTGKDFADFRRNVDHKTARYVTHLGYTDRARVVTLLTISDVLVQPGAVGKFNDYRLPSKIPEFLASGRPVILPATNVGLRLRDGTDALLLYRGDSKEIADRIATVLRDKDLAGRLGSNGREFAKQHFSWERSAVDLERFYHTELDKAARGRA
jgi:glycosyltransferase involved in cell wall biosynthesis